MRTFLAAMAVTASLAGGANACIPPPPPPPPAPDESIEAWQARLTLEAQERLVGYQRQWWNDSQSVLLARVERRDTVAVRDAWDPNFRSPRVRLRPVQWLKGAGPSRPFRLNYEGMTTCGPYGGGEAVAGAVGDVFVVFVREGRPHQDSVITSLAPTNIVDPQLRDRVDRAARR